MPRKGSAAAHQHKEHAPSRARCGVLTVSDSRTRATDETGQVLRSGLERAGHQVVYYEFVPDLVAEIRSSVREARGPPHRCDVLVINGGTGMTRRDVTVEAVRPLLDKELPGFGELFRQISYKSIGSPAWLSRALAGTHKGMLVACLPGSPQAAEPAMKGLLLPEIGHILGMLRR